MLSLYLPCDYIFNTFSDGRNETLLDFEKKSSIYKINVRNFLFNTIINIYLIFTCIPYTGWDFDSYHGALNAVSNNENPYDLVIIEKYTSSYLAFVYPPIFFSFLFF